MKKLLTMIVALAGALSVLAATPKQSRYTNLYEKIPAEGSYVGFAGVELVSPGAYGNGGVNFGITTVHGKMFTSRLFLGAGAGYIADFHNDKGLIPIFVEGRFYFPSQFQRRIYPHIGLRGGVEVATIGSCGGTFQAAIGFRIPLSEKLALNIEVGPQYASKYEREHGEGQASVGAKFRPAGGRFAFFGRVNFEF